MRVPSTRLTLRIGMLEMVLGDLGTKLILEGHLTRIIIINNHCHNTSLCGSKSNYNLALWTDIKPNRF